MPDPKKKKKGVSKAVVKKALSLVKQGQKKKAVAKRKVSNTIQTASARQNRTNSTQLARQRAIAKSDREMIARKKVFLAKKNKKNKKKK